MSKRIESGNNNLTIKFVEGVPPIVEKIGIDIQGYKIVVGGCYIPPRSQTVLYEEQCEFVIDILDNNLYDTVIIAGDYNIPHTRWHNDHQDVNLRNENLMSKSEFAAAQTLAA